MPYGQSALRGHSQAGDPFLGDIVKGIGKVVGAVVPGPVGAIGRVIAGRPAPQPRIIAPRPQVGVMPGGGGARIFPGARTPTRVDPATGMPVRKRRRMNYSNQKALRRALRRASGYARQQKAVRKAASEFAREFGPKPRRARRDVIVPRHTVVR